MNGIAESNNIVGRGILIVRSVIAFRLHDHQVDGDRKVYPALQRLWES
jgi:hypothetical protein